MPRLNRAINPRYRTLPTAARSVGPWAIEMSAYPWAGFRPAPGSNRRPAIRQPATAGTAVTSARPAMLTPFAPSIAPRRGIAARVTRIMPVPYSSVIARTARTAMTAWPRSRPIRESLVGSCPTPPGPPGDTCVEAASAALAATVSATAPAISHQVPAIVRSLVHSARSASVTRLSAAARLGRRTAQPLRTRREPAVRPMAAAGSSRWPSCTDSSRALIGAGVQAWRNRPPG